MTQAAQLRDDALATTAGRGPVGDDRPALRRCLSLDPGEFARTVWGRQPHLSRREDLPASFGDLLTLDDVDELVSTRGLRTPFLRVAKAGQTLSAARFTRGGGVGATIDDQVDDAALARLFGDGATIVLQALHRVHEPVITFAQQLAADLGHPTQVNAYVTPPQSQGFSDHYDVHDVFVLQVAGEKRWMIRPPVHPHPLRDEPWDRRRAEVEAAAAQPPALDVVLRPGDALYLPAGWLHAAQALGETSAHLTVGVHVWTRMHLVEQVVAALGGVEALREPLPLGVDVGDPASIVLELQRTVDTLERALFEVGATEVAAGLARRSAQAGRAAPVRPLAQARAVEAVDLWTSLTWRPHLRATTSRDGDRLIVRTSETTLRLPAAAAPALDRLLRGESVTVAEIGSVGSGQVLLDEDRLEVARILLRAAVASAG